AADHPGTSYQWFDLIEAGYERSGRMTRELMPLFESGVLAPLRAGTLRMTVLTGVLRRLVAPHLLSEPGLRHLLLLGRRGPAAAGAEVLRAELAALGAEVTIAA
ncbi:hypothetical protein VM98_38440, partial [Streptomyces rubellomurinus subsp. indigoferus]